MKKNILIILTIIVTVLLGIWFYMTTEENKYTEKYEKYEINKEEENTEIEKIEEIENINEKNNSNETIPELEDLSNTENSFYSLVTNDDLNKTLKTNDEIVWNDFNLTIKSKNSFSLVDIFVQKNIITQAKRFYNKEQNVLGLINYIDKDFSDENILEIYEEYKSDDINMLEDFSFYNFGEIKETSFKNLKGIYNLTTYSSSREDFEMPIQSRYIAHYNYNGKIIQIIIETYKNCSYGQMSFEELLDLAIDF